MPDYPVTHRRALSALALCLAAGLGTHGSLAQQGEAVVGMSEQVFKVLEQVQVELDAENMPGARELLQEMLTRRLSDYERAHGLNLLGYTWYQDENLERARATYEQALALEKIPPSMQANLLLTLGQVCLVGEDYTDAEGYLRRLLLIPEQNTGMNKVLLASALLGQEKYREALKPLQEAVSTERAAGNIPREQWLAMLSSVYYELSDYSAMRDVVAELATHYPREQYVINLAALHGELGDSERQLALIESLADDERIHQSSQIQLLANLFLSHELPYKAAVLLQQAVDEGEVEEKVSTLELLSQAWYMAAETERAIAPLERAAQLSDDGELYMRLARLHMDNNAWKPAERAARLALEKGGLREEGHAWLLRGMAQVRMEQLREADTLFSRAARFEHSRQYANQWLAFVANEMRRSEALNGNESAQQAGG